MSLQSKIPEVPNVSWSTDAVCRGPDAHVPSARAGAAQAIGLVHPLWRTAGLGPALAGSAKRVWALLLTWQARASQRRALAELDNRLLGDVGLTRGDVYREVQKPFWRA